MQDGVVVRAATADDVSALGPLGAQLVREHHDYDPSRFIAATDATAHAYARFLRAERERADVLLLVAVEHATVLGYVYAAVEGNDYMSLRGPAGVVHDVVVVAARRRQGIGGRLLEAALSGLRARGVPRVVLATAERNVGAQRLFARRGFRRTMIEMTWDPPRSE